LEGSRKRLTKKGRADAVQKERGALNKGRKISSPKEGVPREEKDSGEV